MLYQAPVAKWRNKQGTQPNYLSKMNKYDAYRTFLLVFLRYWRIKFLFLRADGQPSNFSIKTYIKALNTLAYKVYYKFEKH